MVEAFVEEESLEVREGGEEERVEGGVGGARWVGGFVGDVAEAEVNDVGGLGNGVVWEVVAEEAVRWGEAQVVVGGEEGAPGDGGVDRVEHLVYRFLLCWVE